MLITGKESTIVMMIRSGRAGNEVISQVLVVGHTGSIRQNCNECNQENKTNRRVRKHNSDDDIGAGNEVISQVLVVGHW